LPGREDAEGELGAYPWWVSRDWKVRFFRPLTSVTLWLDHALYGGWAAGYHLSSYAWYAGVLLLAYRLYGALGLSPRKALMALVLLVSSTAALFPVGWPANRSSLLDAFFTLGAILVLARHQRWGPGLALAAAIALACFACLAKESGVAAFAVIALYLQWQRRVTGGAALGRWANRGTMLSLAAAAGYMVGLTAFGYGANTVFYPTPWGSPLAFLGRLLILVPVGGLALISPLPVDGIFVVPRIGPYVATAALIVLLPVAWVIGRQRRQLPASGFLAGWAFLTLLPQAGAPPSGRLLLVPSIASSALLALFLSWALSRRQERTPGRGPRAVALILGVSAGPLSAIAVVIGGFQVAVIADDCRRVLLTAGVGPPSLGRREVFMLQSPIGLLGLTPQTLWNVESDDRNLRLWVVHAGRRALRWSRPDERTFVLKSMDGPFLTTLFESIFLADEGSPSPDTVWRTPLFTVEAAAVDEGGLRSFRVRLPESLDEPRYRFLICQEGALTAQRPPGVGSSRLIPRVVPPNPLVP